MNLEIQYLSGDTETRSLDPEHSVSVGRADSCDIQVDEDDVAQLHCRISWSGSAWELKAANLDGVEVNGRLVRDAVLAGGDVIRVGSIDIHVDAPGTGSPSSEGGSAADAPSEETPGLIPLAGSDDEISLVPLDEGEAPAGYAGADAEEEEEVGEDIQLPTEFRQDEPAKPAASRARPRQSDTNRPDRAKKKREEDDVTDDHPINQIFDDDDDSFDDDDLGYPGETGEDEEEVMTLPGQKQLSRPKSDEEEELTEEAAAQRGPVDSGPGLAERLRDATTRRPGEQETLKSPLVLTLGGAAFALLLASATFWFMFTRNTVEGLFQISEAEVAEGSYSQAITHLEEFLQIYPNNAEFSPKATVLLNRARIESRLGGTKEWVEAMAAVDGFRKECQDLDGYDPEQKLYLYTTMVNISLGCADEGGKSLNDTKRGRELLELSDEAERKISLYKADEEKFNGDQARIAKARREAAASLLKQEVLDGGLSRITAALEAKKPMQVLIERRKLMTRYSEFGEIAVLDRELQKALTMEQSTVTADRSTRPSNNDPVKTPGIASLSLTLNTRVRTDEKSEGRTVFVVGRDCLYGVDTVTGHPVWRRIVGLDLPFDPLEVDTAAPGLLLVDTNHHQLVLLRRADGKTSWRLPLIQGQQVVGPPLVAGGQIYLVSEAGGRGHVAKISLESGNLSATLSFSQPVNSPPVMLAGGTQLVMAGHREVLYTISVGGFQCEGVSYLGHPAGAIESPLLAMGELVMLPQNGNAPAPAPTGEGDTPQSPSGAAPAAAGEKGDKLVVAENDRLDSCRLRIIRLAANGTQLAQVAEVRVAGHVRDRSMLRGRDLFVPLSGERLVAFSVSDDPNHDALTTVGTHQVKTPHAGAMHLSVGPGGHLWMASSKLQRFQLTTDSIKVNPNRIAEGLSSQPLQAIGSQLFVGRRLPHSASVVFTRVQRDAEPQMVTHWRTVVGSGLLECQRMSNGLLLCLTENGGLFHVRENELDAAGFKFNIEGELRLPVGLATPLQSTRFSDGRVAVWCGQPAPRMWILNSVGTVEQEVDLQKEALEAAPVLTEGGVVAPLPGRLKLVARSSGQGPAREYPAPVAGGKKRKWKMTVPIDAKHLLVLDDGGDLVRLQYRTAPAPHLYPVSTLKLQASLDLKPVVHGGRVVVATSDAKLKVLGGADLQVAMSTDLNSAATAGPWTIGDRILVEVGRKQLVCVDPAKNLEAAWTIDTPGHSVAGAPLLADGKLVIAYDNGQVAVVKMADGQSVRSADLGQPVSLGPRVFGPRVLITSIDGTLYRVESLLSAPAASETGGP